MARELAAWRERTASGEDRPVGSVLADPPLVELAKRQPVAASRAGADPRAAPADDQAPRPGHPRRDRPRARGRADPPRRGPGPLRPGDAPLIALAEALLRARPLEAGLAYELIASRAELEQIVGAARRGEPEPDVRTLTGWRRELVGADLRDLLGGAARRSRVGAPTGRLASSRRARLEHERQRRSRG